MQLKLSTLLVTCLLLCTHGSQANTSSYNQTKAQLKELENKINGLHGMLSRAHDKHSLLNKELASIEKENSKGVLQLHKMQLEMGSKQRQISDLQNQVSVLSKQLDTQQQLLAKHLYTRYTMGEYQPLKWLLNQDNPYTTSRLLTFYQYIVQSHQHVIDHVQETKKNLTLSQDKLHQDLIEQQQLQLQLNKHQQKLEQDKRYRTAIIHALDRDIQSKKQALQDYEQNKNNLTRLLNSLSHQSFYQTQQPLMYRHKKLPWPITVRSHHLQKINQGVIFYADEGKPVVAVSPGKVVFSDWLKGYGLLLIIDHGQGFMTLYAHNQSLFKQKGEAVNQGEQIATIGHSGGLKENGLYFEIRQRGKAIPPLAWLS